MKILYYSSHPNLALNSASGYGTHMREMIRAFRELGHQVKPVIMGGRQEMYDSSALSSVTDRMKNTLKQAVPSRLWESLKDYRLLRRDHYFKAKLAAEVQSFAPNLIYERTNYLQPSGVRVAQDFNIAHVLEVNSPHLEEKKNTEWKRVLVSRPG